MTPREVSRAADRAGRVPAGREVTRLAAPASTKIRPEAAAVVPVRFGAGIRVELADLTPALAASLRHAASMHNPQFYEKQRMRASTWDIPRFLQFFDETVDGGLIVPRGMLSTVTELAAQAGSKLDLADERAAGAAQALTCSAGADRAAAGGRPGPGRARPGGAGRAARNRQDRDGVRGHRRTGPAHHHAPPQPSRQDTLPGTGRPAPVLYVHPTGYRYDGDADPSRPGGMTAIYRDLAADEQRTRQVIADVLAALGQDRNCLVLTNRTSHLERLADLLREAGHDPVILRGGMGARSRAAALARLQPQPGGPPLLAVATGSYAGEGFDGPALDTLSLAAPVASKGSLTQYAGRILRSHENKSPRLPRKAPSWQQVGRVRANARVQAGTSEAAGALT
jgi:hypothetical protein